MQKYKPTIGLEVHAELNTRTKMFCNCKNDPDEERPNVNICPVCMGHPGTLPVINKEAVKSVLKVGIAVGGQLADKSEFDRKNYFYPDIPKGYQISQYKHPLVKGGELAGVQLTRVHLEEDTGTSEHNSVDYSLVDFNRAGVPLMELVTEPVMHSSVEVVKFAKELQLLLQYLWVAEANMEKGEMRLEANISVSSGDELGTKVEVKNLNSFRAAERAIEFEIKRQSELLEKGEKVKQETRGWDEAGQKTFSQRSKETAHDYRYFPDPDLPKLVISEIPEFADLEIKQTPAGKRNQLLLEYGIKESDVEFYINNQKLGDLFERAALILADKRDSVQTLSNYVVTDIAALGEDAGQVESEDLAMVIKMLGEGKISSRGAKDIIAKLAEGEKGSAEIAEKYDLFQKSNEGDLEVIVKKVIEMNPEVAAEYKAGKLNVLQFLIGQGMKESKGSANPALIKGVFEKLLA